MLKLDHLPQATRLVFEHLRSNSLLQDFTLIGGTALALQIGHRYSEDLDFWLPRDRMEKSSISAIVHAARKAGFETHLATPHDKIVFEKINGRDLLSQAQDYVIGGVKVTFFARADFTYLHFNELPRLTDPETSFPLMGLDGLFAMKSYVIHQRTRSRDLFDLKCLLQLGKSLEDILLCASLADPACSAEYAKSVLTGEVPLDRDDEGFESIGLSESMANIYDYFSVAVNLHEQAVAESLFRPQP